MVESLEKWRAEMGIEDMVLCGHSLGGMITSAYAMAHPHRCVSCFVSVTSSCPRKVRAALERVGATWYVWDVPDASTAGHLFWGGFSNHSFFPRVVARSVELCVCTLSETCGTHGN